MARTEVGSAQIKAGGVRRSDVDIATVGEALVRKIIAGTGITLGSTGADAGTGDVTVNSSGSGHVIKDAGVAETQRTNLDFLDGFAVADNSGADATEVGLDYGVSAGKVAEGNHTHTLRYQTIKDAGSAETQRSALNFLDGFIVTDDSGNDETEVAADFGSGATQIAAGNHTHVGGSGHVVQEDGTNLTARANLDFRAGLVASDAGAGPDSSTVDAPGSALYLYDNFR